MPSRALTDREYKELIKETLKEKNVFIGLRDSLMYQLSRILGFRPMEVRCIKINHINFQERTIFIPAENNKERQSDNWKIPVPVLIAILDYLKKTNVHKKSKWLFPSCHNEAKKQDLPIHYRIHQFNFTERLRRLGFLYVNFIDKQGIPRYNYNLYSLRKRYGTEVYKKTRCPQKTRIMLRQRDKSCKSVWNYIDMAENEETEKIWKEVYPEFYKKEGRSPPVSISLM